MNKNRNKNAEESKADCVKKMGKDLGQIYYALWCEVVNVNCVWNEFVELYGKKPSRIQLLNESAAFFFRTVQDVFWDNTLLHIARLTDPGKSCGKDNLSIQKLPGLVSKIVCPNIQAVVDVAINKSEFSRDWRNRRIAHTDLGLVLKTDTAIPLKAASRNSVKEALSAIGDVLDAVSRPYMQLVSMFDGGFVGAGAAHLIYLLDDGLQMEKERLVRLKSHGWDPIKDARRDL